MAGSLTLTATDANFENEILKSETPCLVDFWAEWCGPCRALGPVVDELASDFNGKVKVFKLNVDENPQVATRFGIRGIPTILLFKNGELADQAVGVLPKAQLADKMNQLL